MSKPITYVAELQHVREVTLLGTADLAYWEERLSSHGLQAADYEGRAKILIIAAEGNYLSLRFRELSFAVFAYELDDKLRRRDGAFLVQAFNSSRLFAFCERTLFSTPYHVGDVHVRTELPSSVALLLRGDEAFRAHMGGLAAERLPVRVEGDGWDGPVFLPVPVRPAAAIVERSNPMMKLFFAKVHGRTQAFPFEAGTDELTLRPTADSAVLQSLEESHFTPTEWLVRPDAVHAKSKTCRR